MANTTKIISLILGGGQGARLYPLTQHRSKPAVPIGGEYRLIDIPITNCLHSGIRRIFVLTQFNSASLNRYIKNTYQFNAFSDNFVDILAAEQTPDNRNWFQGTADAVRQSLGHLAHLDHDYVVVLSGDQLYQMDFSEMVKEHIRKKADLTIATIPVTAKDATGLGIMKVNKAGMIDCFIEKPKATILPNWLSPVPIRQHKAGKNHLASMGIYIFNRAVLTELLEEHRLATDFGKEIIPLAIKLGKRINSYLFKGYWTDIGTIQSFFDANLALTDNIPKFNLYDEDKPIYNHAHTLPPSKFYGTTLKKMICAEGAIVHAKSIEHAVIGIRSRIGEKSVLKSVIMMGANHYEHLTELMKKEQLHIGVGKNCYIERAILDKNCRIGNNVFIKGGADLADADHEAYSIVDGIVVVKKNATIPDGTIIGLDNEVFIEGKKEVLSPNEVLEMA
jgi:glucose-1-phosphate adenylyltransferase